MHTTRYGNTYTDEEWAEVQEEYRREEGKAAAYFEIRDAKIISAAGFLNREFPQVPVSHWEKALHENYRWDREPREIKFTTEKKAERFAAAMRWIDSEINDGLARI